MLPLAALLGERATRTEHKAAEDTFCLQLNKPAFIKLFALSGAFRDFALRGVSSLLDQVNQQVQQKAVENLGTQYSLNTRLGELAMRHPVTCSPLTPLREAVTLMHEQQVGSIVVVDEHKAPLGIFTLRDLRHVVADGTSDFTQAIERHMTQAPFFLSPDHSAFDAAIAMTERHIAHVCLVKDRRLCGVVSERDLFSCNGSTWCTWPAPSAMHHGWKTWWRCVAKSVNWWSACWPMARPRPRSPISSRCSTITRCAG